MIIQWLKAVGRLFFIDKLVHAVEKAWPNLLFTWLNLSRRPFGDRMEIRLAGKVALYDLFPCRNGSHLCAIGHYGWMSPQDVRCSFASGEVVSAQMVEDTPHAIEGEQVLILMFPVPAADRAARHTRVTLTHKGDILLREQAFRLDVNQKNHAFSVATLMKDEDRFLPEWIAYYRLLGADHFYIYDNRSLKRNRIRQILNPLIETGVVTLIDWDYPYVSGDVNNSWRFCQRGQMHHCLYKYGARSKWMLFIDVDEFIFPLRGENSLLPLLEQYEKDASVAGLHFKMIWFGNSGHIEVPSGLVIENYTRRAPTVLPDGRQKYAVKPNLVDTLFIHDVKQSAEGTRIQPVPPDQYRINHYFATSSKRRRRRSPEHNEVEDHSMARFVPFLRQSLSKGQM